MFLQRILTVGGSFTIFTYGTAGVSLENEKKHMVSVLWLLLLSKL